MTTIISIKGQNTRMGKLFKTPKYNLLYKGRPALEQTVEYMRQFGEVKVITHENSDPDVGITDMLLQLGIKQPFFVVDCDVIPIKLGMPEGNTVYLFRNEKELTCYSNFQVFDGKVTRCNEKEKAYAFAGAGVYYFADGFYQFAQPTDSLAQVMAKLLPVKADTTSEIFRFGSLQTIMNNKCN